MLEKSICGIFSVNVFHASVCNFTQKKFNVHLCGIIKIVMPEYLTRALSVWFIGFFPWAEIYVAVPAGFGLGLDIYSIVGWSVFGNYLPAIIIAMSYDSLLRYPRINRWFSKLSSPKIKTRIEKNGIWATLLLTPWLGVWAMAATVKIFGMKTRPFLLASLVSLLVYAVVLSLIIDLGIGFFS